MNVTESNKNDPSAVIKRCPVCNGEAEGRPDGTLSRHARYADGSGPFPDQPHDYVLCEGGEDSDDNGQ